MWALWIILRALHRRRVFQGAHFKPPEVSGVVRCFYKDLTWTYLKKCQEKHPRRFNKRSLTHPASTCFLFIFHKWDKHPKSFSGSPLWCRERHILGTIQLHGNPWDWSTLQKIQTWLGEIDQWTKFELTLIVHIHHVMWVWMMQPWTMTAHKLIKRSLSGNSLRQLLLSWFTL